MLDYNTINDELYPYSDSYENNCDCYSNYPNTDRDDCNRRDNDRDDFNRRDNDRDNFNCPDVRTELIVNQSPQTICNILQELKCQNIQIDGFSIQAICDKCSVFRFVVGGANRQSLTDVDIAKSILCQKDIDFLETAILKVDTDRNFNLADAYCALQRNVNVAAAYFGRTDGVYFQVDKLIEAINTLRRCG